jgi:hypothetical protein
MLRDELVPPPAHSIEQAKLAYAGTSIEPQPEVPDVLGARGDPAVPKKSPGVARIVKAKRQNSDVARS